MAIQTPFLGTAFRIDETNILSIAKQIERSPLDPYGFEINWNGTLEPAFSTLANPPLVPAWLALFARGFGWSEVSMHVAMLPFSILFLLSFPVVARRFGIGSPLPAAALAAVSPGFFLGSQVVMPDVAMLSALITAVAGALLYLDTGRRGWLVVACVAAGLAPMLKYNGVLVIPLLGALWLVAGKKRSGLTLTIVTPIVVLVSWNILSMWKYGRPHMVALSEMESAAAVNGLTGALSSMGIGVIPLVIAFGGMARPVRRLRSLSLISAAILFLAIASWLLNYPGLPSALFALSVLVAVDFIWSTFDFSRDQWRQGNHAVIMLPVWVAVVVSMQFRLLFTSVRYVLPVLPAALLVLGVSRARTKWFPAALVINGLFVLSIAIGDARIANMYRNRVESAVASIGSHGRLFYAGHWGLQYYAGQAGGEIVTSPPSLRAGDVLLVARTPFPGALRPAGLKGVHSKHLNGDPRWPIRTVDCDAAANFYGTVISGCRFFPVYLPYGFGSGPAETFDLFVQQ